MHKLTMLGNIRFKVGLLLVAAFLLADPSARAQQEMSRSDRSEVEQGAEADKQIEAQFGFYEDAELGAYVTAIGERMAGLSERPQLPWTFRVLDSPVVNAFALPGGFVYVTRGLVAYADSEAELAGVIGHEIGHVTGKHSKSRQRASLWTNLAILGGAVAGSMLSDTVGELVAMGLPQLAAGLILTKYSRGQELDADERGIRYATQAGYDPYGIGGFFETLQSLEAQSDRKKLPGWISTHPQVDDRIERSNRWAELSLRRFALQPEDLFTGRRELFAEVDGVVFGENPREGYMAGNEFIHPDLRFSLAFPPEWAVENGRSAVTVMQPEQLAYMKLELAAAPEGQSSEEYVRAYLREIGAVGIARERVTINGLAAIEASFTVRGEPSDYAVLGTWIEYDGRLYRLLGVTSPARWRQQSPTMRRSTQSFAELTDEDALGMEAARVRVVEVNPSMQLLGVIEQYPEVSVSAQTLAILNHRPLDGLIEAGDVVKLVVGGPRER